MRRTLLAGTIVLAALVAGCASGDDASTTAPTTSAPAGAGSSPTPSSTSTNARPATSEDVPGATTATSAPGSTATPAVAATPVGPACGLAAAAFCETFDAPRGDPTQRTGDLDPVIWGVSRLGDINPGSAANNITPAHLVGCGGTAATPPPLDVRICGGQMIEALNDGASVANLATYPKQPFTFAGRPDGGHGTVVFDVSADSEGSHSAWPEFVITDEPVPAVRRSISFQPPPHATNEVGFSIDQGCEGQPDTTGVGVVFYSADGQYAELNGDRPDCITKGSSAAMNHFEVHISSTHLDVYGTDAGATQLKLLASEDVPLSSAFTQGLVWLNDVHYNARKSIEPCQCGTQFDHSFAWDNLGFDGPKTYRDLGYDVPDAHRSTSYRSTAGDATIEEGYSIGPDGSTFTLDGVRWDQTPKKAKVVLNVYSFDPIELTVSLNGHDAVASEWRDTDAGFAWRSISVEVPLADVVQGTNTLTFVSDSDKTVIANPSLIIVAGAPVP